MVYEISEEDYHTLLRIVEAEAGCEDENGKLLVGSVHVCWTYSDFIFGKLSKTGL